MVFPEDAGIGATPQRCAKDDFSSQPVWVVSDGDQQSGGGVGPEPEYLRCSGSYFVDEFGEQALQFFCFPA